jgi:hypothetical protein
MSEPSTTARRESLRMTTKKTIANSPAQKKVVKLNIKRNKRNNVSTVQPIACNP